MSSLTEGYRQTTVRSGSRQRLQSPRRKQSQKANLPQRRENMKRRLTMLFTTVLTLVFGVAACGVVQEELEKRAQEEVDKQRQRAEDRVREEVTRLLEGQ
jgi:hypothetical protein